MLEPVQQRRYRARVAEGISRDIPRGIKPEQGRQAPICRLCATRTAFRGHERRMHVADRISYPADVVTWQPLTLLSGTNWCDAPSVDVSGGVVYMTGIRQLPAGFTGEFAVLPPGAVR